MDEFADPDLGGDDDAKISVDAVNTAVADVTVQTTRDLTVDAMIDMQNAGVGVDLVAGRDLKVNEEIHTDGGAVRLQSDADNDGTGTTQLNIDTAQGLIESNGGDITFIGPVQLQRRTLVDSGDFVNNNDGDITFWNDVTGPHLLRLEAGTSGDVTLHGDTDVSTFHLIGFEDFVNNGSLTADGILLSFATGTMQVGSNCLHAAGSPTADIRIEGGTGLTGFLTAAWNLIIQFTANIDINVQVGGNLDVAGGNGVITGTVQGTTSFTDGSTVVDNTTTGGGGGPANPARSTSRQSSTRPTSTGGSLAAFLILN